MEEERMSTIPQPGPDVEEPTIGKLVADATRDVSTLIHGEIELAKSELKASVRAGTTGLGLFAGAALLVLLGLVLLSIAFAEFLTMTGLHPAWCFLIVFVVYLLIAGVLAWVGVRKVKQAGPPRKAIDEAKRSKNVLTRA
jgi:hypothetical protein